MDMKRKLQPNGQHLTLDQRKIIQIGIENRSNKVDIARTLGKDATTIAKEIRAHRILKPRNTFNHHCVSYIPAYRNEALPGTGTSMSSYKEA